MKIESKIMNKRKIRMDVNINKMKLQVHINMK